MKKIKWLFVMVVFVVVGAVCIAFIVKNEKNKQAPIERYYEKNESEEDNEKDHTGESKKENQTDSNDFTERHSFQQGNIIYEFLSVDIVEETEIKTQTKYPAANFYDEVFPDSNYQATVRDWKTMVEEAPELKNIFESSFDYSYDEYEKIYDKYEDIIKKNTYEAHPNTRYYFVHMRVTNTSDEKNRDVVMNELRTIVTNGNKKTSSINESICYFSSPQNIRGEERAQFFFWYNMAPGEVLECTVGFQVRDDWIYPSDQYVYAGFVSSEMYNQWVNPVLSKTVVPLYDLPQSE